MKLKSEVKIELIYDRLTGRAGFRAHGLRTGDEKLLNQLLQEFSLIVSSTGFRDQLIKQAFSKSWYKSKDPNVAPIWRKESGKPLIV